MKLAQPLNKLRSDFTLKAGTWAKEEQGKERARSTQLDESACIANSFQVSLVFLKAANRTTLPHERLARFYNLECKLLLKINTQVFLSSMKILPHKIRKIKDFFIDLDKDL